jgi:maltooligosyltrehalose synthase
MDLTAGFDAGNWKKFWDGTEIVLQEERANIWRNVLTGEQVQSSGTNRRIAVGELLMHFPVGLLSSSVS